MNIDACFFVLHLSPHVFDLMTEYLRPDQFLIDDRSDQGFSHLSWNCGELREIISVRGRRDGGRRTGEVLDSPDNLSVKVRKL